MSINPKQEQLHQFKTMKYIKIVHNPDKIELGQAVQLQSSENYKTTHHEMCLKRDKQKTLEDKNINLSLSTTKSQLKSNSLLRYIKHEEEPNKTSKKLSHLTLEDKRCKHSTFAKEKKHKIA